MIAELAVNSTFAVIALAEMYLMMIILIV